MEVTLRVTAGPHAGQECVLRDDDECVVGRSSHVEFSMHEDRLLSREHFQIVVRPPVCALKDLGSTNGTKVNGLRVEEIPLRDGDVITAGDSAFSVAIERTALGDSPPIRCLACGQAASLLGAEARRDVRLHGWLCESCHTLRQQFPPTDPDYLIERKIGSGGMGEVYLARQLSTNRPVAIKMMVPTGAVSAKAREYFQREMRVLRDLLMPDGATCHPNIVTFYDIFEIDGQFQLVMEHVAGKNALEWVMGLSVPLPSTSAARIGRALLSALEYAHGKGYVHRDVKPSNLLVMGPHQRPQVKLSDFGLAKNFRDNAEFERLTLKGDICGSVAFISPDHIRDFGEVKEPADIYCAGVTLYYLLTLKYPYFNFDPRKADAYCAILEHPPVPLRAHRPDAPEGLERVLRKALAKNPRDRWKSASAMAEALRPFLDGGGSG